MTAEEFAKEVASLIDTRTKALNDRIADLETMIKSIAQPRDGRDGLPGIQGPPGQAGADGKDGVVSIDDIPIEYDGERTITLLGKSIRLPIPIYREVYQREKQYDADDMVTFGGSMWRCKSATSNPPNGGSPDWTLIVKAGRDGRDLKGA